MTCKCVCVYEKCISDIFTEKKQQQKLAWPITVHGLLVVVGEHDRLLQIKCHLATVSWMLLMFTLFLDFLLVFFFRFFNSRLSLLTYLTVIRRKYNLFVFMYFFWALNDPKMKVSFQDMSFFTWQSQLLSITVLTNHGFSFS